MKTVLLTIDETCNTVELAELDGELLNGDALRVAREAIALAGEVAGGEIYTPSDGDTYLYETLDIRLAIGLIARTMLQSGFEILVQREAFSR